MLLLALCIGAGFATGDAAAKKKHKASVFSASLSPNAAIPDRPATAQDIVVASTVTVGKKFKGKTVGDVNVTGIRTTGSATNAAQDLSFSISPPNGKVVLLEGTALGGQNIGPLTLDDDTPTSICNDSTLSCTDPNATLIQPFAGTANLLGLATGDTSPLSMLNGSQMRGTWTFRIWDNSNNGKTSTLNGWGLRITPERPVR